MTKHTPETLAKMSISQLAAWQRPERAGRAHRWSVEERATISAAQRASWANPATRAKRLASLKDPASRERVKETWQDPNIAVQRTTRDQVVVNGIVYGSVLAAFTALQLPIAEHQEFRLKLKADRAATFVFGGRAYHFKTQDQT